ncbi:MAG TPA: transglycosylase SLT domain-containing protein [Candidatus Acidoferrales bacterium]|nr:transglycosylase SLT domain-containing protein [Candidatus Acidoferrales bacterium]
MSKALARRLIVSLLLFSLAASPVRGEDQELPAETPFPLLEGLEKAVEFWIKIFTVYTTTQVVLFDAEDPATIYKVLELPIDRAAREAIKTERRALAAALEIDEHRVRGQRGIKERFVEGLVRSRRYLGQMQQIFRDHGLPVELAYLPLVESSFNIQARSSAGAVGMWQFIRSTGRRFLRIDRHIDERKDPIESTRAAALFLKENYEALGSWPLAITAYNHGAEGVARGVEQVGSNNLVDLIRLYESRTWGFASKNFYAEFLAALHVAQNRERYFPGLEPDAPLSLQEIALEKPTPVHALLKSAGVPLARFLEWNPALSARIAVLPRGYRVKISGEKFAPAQPVREPVEQAMLRHKVKRGETLYQIARRYEASVEEIAEANGLKKTRLLNIGQVLIIPR